MHGDIGLGGSADGPPEALDGPVVSKEDRPIRMDASSLPHHCPICSVGEGVRRKFYFRKVCGNQFCPDP